MSSNIRPDRKPDSILPISERCCTATTGWSMGWYP